jgi:hypothetical protein
MAHSDSAAPYPQSTLIARLDWDGEEQIVRLGGERCGDNWPLTWGDDDLLYTSYADGYGFARGTATNYTLAFATIAGQPPHLLAQDLPSTADVPVGWGPEGIKASGLLMAQGMLYLWVRNAIVAGNWRHARLAWSADHGRHWEWATWHIGSTFGCPEWVQFGPNYQGARDGYVYTISQDGDSAYGMDPAIVMARVPLAQVRDWAAYEFYAGADADGQPRWSADIAQRQPIFRDPRGTQRVSVTYNAALRRYVLVTPHADGSGATHTGALGVFEAPEPWGPWRTVYYDDLWSRRGWMIHHKFPTKWMSADGHVMWLAFSGQYKTGGTDYCLMARRAVLTLA